MHGESKHQRRQYQAAKRISGESAIVALKHGGESNGARKHKASKRRHRRTWRRKYRVKEKAAKESQRRQAA